MKIVQESFDNVRGLPPRLQPTHFSTISRIAILARSTYVEDGYGATVQFVVILVFRSADKTSCIA